LLILSSLDISINFFDPDATQVSLEINPKRLVIDEHDLGNTALSQKATITNTSPLGNPPATVCVQSFASVLSPHNSINQVVADGSNGNNNKVQCIFDNGSGNIKKDCLDDTTGSACTTIEPQSSATFSVLMPEKVSGGPRFFGNSPYDIVFSAGGTETYTLKFWYEARDILP